MPTKSITQLMMDIEMLVPRLEGWCSVEKAHHLAAIVLGLRPTVTVEIGVFGGRSVLPMAMGHAFNGHGYVIAIDPWAKAASLDGMAGENAEWWGKLDHELIYQQFMRAANRHVAEDWLKVHRMTADEAVTVGISKPTTPHVEPIIPLVIDLLHIDGNHGPQAVKDVDNYATRLRPGGILIMDDMDWATAAAARVRELKFNFLYNLGTGAVFQR